MFSWNFANFMFPPCGVVNATNTALMSHPENISLSVYKIFNSNILNIKRHLSNLIQSNYKVLIIIQMIHHVALNIVYAYILHLNGHTAPYKLRR